MINLKDLRKQKNITQKKLAYELNLSRPTISMYETGLSEPDIEILFKIADYFGVSVDYLLGRETPSQEPVFPLLNEENRQKINSYAESLLAAQNGAEASKMDEELTFLITQLDEQQKEQLTYFIKGMLQNSLNKNFIG